MLIYLKSTTAIVSGSIYAANGFEPPIIADYGSALGSFGTGYFEKNSTEVAHDDLATLTTSGNRTTTGSAGTLLWAAHNLLTYSEALDDHVSNDWVSTATTVAAAGIDAPYGSSIAVWKVTHTASAAAFQNNSLPTLPSAEHTVRFIAKYFDNQWVRFLVQGPNVSNYFDVKN